MGKVSLEIKTKIKYQNEGRKFIDLPQEWRVMLEDEGGVMSGVVNQLDDSKEYKVKITVESIS